MSSSSWTGDCPAARLSDISLDVKEGMAVPAALIRNERLCDYWRTAAHHRCPYHLVRRIVHGSNLDPRPQSVSLEAGSWHPRRYVFDYREKSVRRRPRVQRVARPDIRAGKKSTRTEPGLPLVTVSVPASSAKRTYRSSVERTVCP